MTVRIPKCTLTEAQKAYIAGFIDGEGNLNIRKHPRSFNGKRYYTHSIRTVLTNTDLRPIDFIQGLVGGKRYTRTQHLGVGHQRCYSLALNGAESQKLLKQILPYLIVKKEIADLMLEYPLGWEKQGKELFAQRETIYLRFIMLGLNHASKCKRPPAQTEREDSEN